MHFTLLCRCRPGIPVATVAIDGGMNAAILAARILAVSDAALLERLKEYTKENERDCSGEGCEVKGAWI